jgi:ribonuclease HI
MVHRNNRWWSRYRPGNSIEIATDGACRNNGRADAVAGCGVYWGPNDSDNRSFQLRDGVHPTSQRAELTAAICALSDFRDIFLNGEFAHLGRIDYVVIKTDSAYVAKSMTDWIVEWSRNGYLDYSRRPICNKDLIQKLDSLCREIGHDLGVQACFWQVGRDENKDADRLAKAAIRDISSNVLVEASSVVSVGFVHFC